MSVRPCGDDCGQTEGKPHLEPEVFWIGDSIPLLHGEREAFNGDDEWEYCLCGHHPYYICPGDLEGGIWTMTVGDPYGGRFDD